MRKADRDVIEAALKGLTEEGYSVALWVDGRTYLAGRVLEAIGQCNEEWIHAVNHLTGSRGWVRLIYGNAPGEVINDYSANLEGPLAKANSIAQEFRGW